MTIKLTFEINPKSKAGKAFLEMVEAVYQKVPGIKITEKSEMNGSVSENKSISEEEFIEYISTKTNKASTKKLFDLHNLDYE